MLRALVGRHIVPDVRGLGPSTIRFQVLGFGADDVRVRSTVSGERSTITIDALERELTSGFLRIAD